MNNINDLLNDINILYNRKKNIESLIDLVKISNIQPINKKISSEISVLTWNIGLVPKNPKNLIGEISENVFKSIIDIDSKSIICLQEVKNTQIFGTWAIANNYEMITCSYNYKNPDKKHKHGHPDASLVTLINKNVLKLIDIKTQEDDKMIIEDPENPVNIVARTQKFTKFYIVIVQDKITKQIIYSVNIHLKGGNAGYHKKKVLLERLIKYIDDIKKENKHVNVIVIINGDFNINFETNKGKDNKTDYGFDELKKFYEKDTCSGFTLKQKPKNDVMPTEPNIKYDYIFHTKEKNIEMTNCEVLIPKNYNNYVDHYPLNAIFSISSSQ